MPVAAAEFIADGAPEEQEVADEGAPEIPIESAATGPDELPLPAASLALDLGTWETIGPMRGLFAVEGGADAMVIDASDYGIYWTPLTSPGQVGNAAAGTCQDLVLSPRTIGGRCVRFAFDIPNADPTLGGLAEIEIWP